MTVNFLQSKAHADNGNIVELNHKQYGPCENYCVTCGIPHFGKVTNVQENKCGTTTYTAEVDAVDTQMGFTASKQKLIFTLPISKTISTCNSAPIDLMMTSDSQLAIVYTLKEGRSQQDVFSSHANTTYTYVKSE